MTALFDTHAHLQDPAFDRDRDAAFARARAAGVSELVVVGEDEPSSAAAVVLAAHYPGEVWATAGLHPHKAKRADRAFPSRLRALAQHPSVRAIGEIGLDFHYDRSPRPVQAEVFRAQLAVAAELDLPVAIHSREAEAETLTILAAWSAARHRAGARAPLGVMHCFGYGEEAAIRFVELGFMVSIPGTVTFPKADLVRAVARAVPAAALVIETDAPVLAPVPFRGKRNEPAYLAHTAQTVAELRGLSVEELGRLTSANARHLYRIADCGLRIADWAAPRAPSAAPDATGTGAPNPQSAIRNPQSGDVSA